MRVGIVGAGLSGLIAAGELADAGHEVVLVDKGRGPGGRLATRRIGAARFDHGAQFFTVRTERFARFVERWQAEGLVREWCRGFPSLAGGALAGDAAPLNSDAPLDRDAAVVGGAAHADAFVGDGYPRYMVVGGFNALAKRLADGLDVRAPAMAFAIRPAGEGWSIGLDDASAIVVDALVVTTPIPQTIALMITSGIELPEALTATEYDRTIALLAVLDRPGSVPAPGGVQGRPGVGFGFIGDNQAKGVSTVPAITFHADAAWSETHWNDPLDCLGADLLAAAAPWLGGARVIEYQVKKWRFATPRTIWPDPCWRAPGTRVVLAGDAFAGPRVEGAALSGLAAAASLNES